VPSTRYVLFRVGKGFVPGVVVGVIWALWTIRRRRRDPEWTVDSQQRNTHQGGEAALRPAG
jgi:hypothetical protein